MLRAVKEIEKISESVTSKVYSVKSMMNEELIVKVPKVSLSTGFNDLIFESQILRLYNQDEKTKGKIPIIHEEVFEIESESQSVFNYAVILNRP